jgi:hypothetical protein
MQDFGFSDAGAAVQDFRNLISDFVSFGLDLIRFSFGAQAVTVTSVPA